MIELPVFRALFYSLLTLLLGALAWLFVNSDAAWATLVGGLSIQLSYHLWQWRVLEQWSRNPSPEQELGGSGAWYEPFSRIFRHERELRNEIAYWQGELARFGAAGQALTFGIVAVGEGGRIEWMNRAAETQLGLDPRSDIGQPIINLVRQPAFVNYLSRRNFSAPLQIRAERSTERSLSIHIVPYGENRQLIQISDVTQARQLDQMRSDFVANVSHELRTPLTVLSGFLETLRELDLSPEEHNHYLGLMAEQSDRMQRIVQDLLALSTLESSPPPPVNEHVDMVNLVGKLMRDAEALSGGRHHITLETGCNCDLLGAEGEISSALGNLVSNAVRYTPAGGDIRISWGCTTGGAEFVVEDSGLGIEAAAIPRLTERFYRVDRSRSRETGGTGLGLAIVKHALGRHQATLDITSTPGKGSRFAARFPASRVVS